MKTLAFGEILWDVIDGQDHIGGAPFNLASHLSQLGADSAVVSAVGDDDRGRRALEMVKSMGLRTSYLGKTENLPTGVVLVELDAAGKPTYDIREGSAWDNIELSGEQLDAIRAEKWDILVCGTLAQRTEHNRLVLRELVRAAAPKDVFFDVNLRLDYYSAEILGDSLEMTDILKLNDEEVPVVSAMVLDGEVSDREFCEEMERDWNIHTVAITRGKDGASVYGKGRYIDVPVVDVPVVDTVGAGDSFSAAFLYGLNRTGDIQVAAEIASKVSSFVASRSGAIPKYDKELWKEISRL